MVSVSYQITRKDNVFGKGNIRRLKVQINVMKTQFRGDGNVSSLKRRNFRSTPEFETLTACHFQHFHAVGMVPKHTRIREKTVGKVGISSLHDRSQLSLTWTLFIKLWNFLIRNLHLLLLWFLRFLIALSDL